MYSIGNNTINKSSVSKIVSEPLSGTESKEVKRQSTTKVHRKTKEYSHFDPLFSFEKTQLRILKHKNYRKPDYEINLRRYHPYISSIPISYSPLPANHTVVVITAGGTVGIGGMMNGRKCLLLSKTR